MMNRTDYYCNRDIDASLMVRRLLSNLHISSSYAKERIKQLDKIINECVQNYKAYDQYDEEAGTLRLLILNREQWSTQGAFDDCTHWL